MTCEQEEKEQLIENDQKKEFLKKKGKWGPIERMERPRRFPKDGKTTMQRAKEYLKYKNMEEEHRPMKGKSFANCSL